jgi:hypothetical protein
MSQPGSRTWFFPDSDIPPAGEMEPRGHESLVMLNPNDADAEVVITVYFEGREPDVLTSLDVGARRVRCIRTSDPIDGYRIPLGDTRCDWSAQCRWSVRPAAWMSVSRTSPTTP